MSAPDPSLPSVTASASALPAGATGSRLTVRRVRGMAPRGLIARFAMLIVVLLPLVAILAPVLAPSEPLTIDSRPFLSPGADHLMGTDNLGRDTLSQFLYATRVTLLIGVAAVVLSTVLGVTVGTVAGYFGGIVDEVVMRVTEFFQVIPQFLLAIVLVAVAGPSVWTVIAVIGGLSWPMMARVVRSEVLSLREMEFVEAARGVGARPRYIMLREILPNARGPIVVNASLEVSQAILLAAGLSFIGLGDPQQVDWGSMLNLAQPFLRDAWWMWVFPGGGIVLAVWSLNIVGDVLNDKLNPRRDES
jgi:peptide/nickel transport system permease protein